MRNAVHHVSTLGLGLVIFSTCLLAGCGGPPGGVKPTPKPTPEEVFTAFADAVASADEQAVLGLIAGDESVHYYFAERVRLAGATQAFIEKFKLSYGSEAWEAFQALPPLGAQRADYKFEGADFEKLAERAVRWEHKPEKDNNVFIWSSGVYLKPIEVDGGWQIDGTAFVEDIANFHKAMNDLSSTIRVIELHTKAIGREGIAAEDIDHQMALDHDKALYGFTPTWAGPPRYDATAF